MGIIERLGLRRASISLYCMTWHYVVGCSVYAHMHARIHTHLVLNTALIVGWERTLFYFHISELVIVFYKEDIFGPFPKHAHRMKTSTLIFAGLTIDQSIY